MLTPEVPGNDTKAIQLLSAGLTQADTARALNLSRATITGWLQDKDFRDEVEKRKDNQVFKARQRMLTMLDTALASMERALKNEDGKNYGRVLEIYSKSIGLLDQSKTGNAYIFKSHRNQDRFIELIEEQKRIWDLLSDTERLYVAQKLKKKDE